MEDYCRFDYYQKIKDLLQNTQKSNDDKIDEENNIISIEEDHDVGTRAMDHIQAEEQTSTFSDGIFYMY
ncbi:MAG: hypothetical protein ACR5LB_09400 [Wolbachia sp.]